MGLLVVPPLTRSARSLSLPSVLAHYVRSMWYSYLRYFPEVLSIVMTALVAGTLDKLTRPTVYVVGTSQSVHSTLMYKQALLLIPVYWMAVYGVVEHLSSGIDFSLLDGIGAYFSLAVVEGVYVAYTFIWLLVIALDGVGTVSPHPGLDQEIERCNMMWFYTVAPIIGLVVTSLYISYGQYIHPLFWAAVGMAAVYYYPLRY